VGRSPWIKIWDPIEGKPIQSIPNPLRDSVGVAYSSEGRFIGFGSGKILVVWDLANGREKFSLHGHLYAINRVAFSPDDKYIISAAGDANIKVWDLSLGGLVHTLQGHEEDVFDISFSDQNRLASASYDGTVRLWDVGAGKQLQILVRHNGKIRGVDFSNNDKWLAAIGEKGFVRIWNAVASDWNQFRDLYGYDWDFYDVAFSPDNKYLVGSSWDKVVIWSVESGEPVASIYIQMGPKALAFSPVGDVLAVGEEDDIVLFPMDFSGIEIDPQRKIDKLGQEFQVEMEGAEMYYLYGD